MDCHVALRAPVAELTEFAFCKLAHDVIAGVAK